MPQRDPVTGLTPQQETFAKALSLGKSQSDAYREAYPRSLKWKPESLHVKASAMAANDKVKARLRVLGGKVQEIHTYTQAEALSEANEAFLLARKQEDPKAMTSAVGMKAKIAGLLVSKVEIQKTVLDGLTHDEVKGLLAILDQADKEADGIGGSQRDSGDVAGDAPRVTH